jgi:hypothetical protein
MKVKRHLMALAATAALVGAGSSQAVACGDSCAPNVASQSSSSSQILPISLGLGAAVPVNANVPIGVLSGGPVQGAVTQGGKANATGSAKNLESTQSVRQQGAGGNTASQATSSSQILPISLGLGAAVPVNANVPVGVLSGGPVQGVVSQKADARGNGEAINNETNQGIEQKGGEHGGNSASQSASNSQILPIALGAGVALPVNANVPVSVLSMGPAQGAVSQDGRARGNSESLNNETEQTIRQDGEGKGAGNSASQSASNSQILPIALGASLAIPVNANIPVSILSMGPAQGDVTQRGDAGAKSRAVGVEHDQDIRQRGGEGGNSASQSASNSQILPVSLGAALAVPVNANVPISILSSGPVQGAVAQKGKANAANESIGNETEQTVRQDGSKGGNTVSQDAANSQILPIALGAALAIPINLNIPISILSSGPVQGAVSQIGDATATSTNLGHELNQLVDQNAQKAEQMKRSGVQLADTTGADQQIADPTGALPVATDLPVDPNLPVQVLDGKLPLGLGIVGKLVETVRATLADPFGTLAAVIKDPIGSVVGLLSSL